MGWVLSFENLQSGCRRRNLGGRPHDQQRYRELLDRPCVVVDPMHIWTFHAREPGDLGDA
jgi:hypothetical protein